MKTRKYTIIIIVMVISSVLMSACGESESTIDIDAQKTNFAYTADVQASLTAQAQPTATATIQPTMTSVPVETLESDATLADTTTEETAESTATSAVVSGTDGATWRAQDPDDNTEFSPGEEFTVTWTIENTGTTTWTTDYYIQFESGDQMSADDTIYLPYSASPNTSVEISADFIAPSTDGEYTSYWSLVNTSGYAFYSTFYIIIEVVSE